jgi:predicted ATPase
MEYARRAYVPEALRPDDPIWPFTVPAVAELADHGLEFIRPLTFLVGDNGSGKSTIVEAIAEGFGLDARGGRAARKAGNPRPDEKTLLGQALRLDLTSKGARMLGGPRLAKKGFFLRAETAFSMTEALGGVPGYWAENTAALSHGEGFVAILRSMFTDPGFYVLDEPESALSFTTTLYLVALLHELSLTGAQIVCATHSPILASTPGADIVEAGLHGLRRVEWADLELVDHWRRYLGNPHLYLRHLLDQ